MMGKDFIRLDAPRQSSTELAFPFIYSDDVVNVQRSRNIQHQDGTMPSNLFASPTREEYASDRSNDRTHAHQTDHSENLPGGPVICPESARPWERSRSLPVWFMYVRRAVILIPELGTTGVTPSADVTGQLVR